jgi:hypothetical protein
MYNQKPQLEIEDFLEAIDFVAPPGFEVSYFVVPRGGEVNLPPQSGFNQAQSTIDESITYHRTPAVEKLDVAEEPIEYSIWEPDALKRKEPAPHPLPRVTDPSELKSPFVKMINESRERSVTFVLKESVWPFKVGTLFHCERRRVKEAR